MLTIMLLASLALNAWAYRETLGPAAQKAWAASVAIKNYFSPPKV